MDSQFCICLPFGRLEIVQGPVPAVSAALNVLENVGLCPNDFYILHNGRKIDQNEIVKNGFVYIVPRLNGGKGGFGSMLRAIGAQIEKTTNREACRDLSGRRLRDINEEKRLKSWITQQADREREAAERKRQRLERLMAEPKLEFKDAAYEAARSEMTEKVSDAVEQGFKAASSSQAGPSKRPSTTSTATSAPPKKKKKTCLWLGSEEEDLSSSVDSDDSDADDVTGGAKAKCTEKSVTNKGAGPSTMPTEAKETDDVKATTAGTQSEESTSTAGTNINSVTSDPTRTTIEATETTKTAAVGAP